MPEAGPQWAYRVAREYTEEYEPSYGNGLIPKSAPRVEEIADFWCRHFFKQPLREWLQSRPPKRPKAPPKPAARSAPPPRDDFADSYPTIASWIKGGGWIEIGQAGELRSFVRALDEGGMVWEGKHEYASFDAALAALQRGIAKWPAQNG